MGAAWADTARSADGLLVGNLQWRGLDASTHGQLQEGWLWSFHEVLQMRVCMRRMGERSMPWADQAHVPGGLTPAKACTRTA